MSKKGTREIVFVCSSIDTIGVLISKIISASTPDEASDLFFKENSIFAQAILGPFYKKSTQILETVRTLKFAKNNPRKAIFEDWLVNAFMLVEPANQAYLVFIKRADDKRLSAPKGTITVPIVKLRFLDE